MSRWRRISLFFFFSWPRLLLTVKIVCSFCYKGRKKKHERLRSIVSFTCATRANILQRLIKLSLFLVFKSIQYFCFCLETAEGWPRRRDPTTTTTSICTTIHRNGTIYQCYGSTDICSPGYWNTRNGSSHGSVVAPDASTTRATTTFLIFLYFFSFVK